MNNVYHGLLCLGILACALLGGTHLEEDAPHNRSSHQQRQVTIIQR